jgi:hypothetical protein
MDSFVNYIKSLQTTNRFKNIKSFNVYEIVLFLSFIIYIVFPIYPPTLLASIVNSPLGIIILFLITVSLFLYANPILGFTYIFVAYILLMRSKQTELQQIPSMGSEPRTPPQEPTRTTRSIPISQPVKDAQLQLMNVEQNPSLEEEVIQTHIPLNQNQSKVVEIEHNFLPVSDKIITGTSLYV